MSKKDNSPAISFFSFQDIITSVTGIMFLVVIMILLLLFNATPTKQPTESKQEDADEQEIRRQIESARAKIAQLVQLKQDIDQRIEEYRKLSPEQIEAEIQLLSKEIAKINAESPLLDEQIIRETESLKELRENILDLQKKERELQQKNTEAKAKLATAEEKAKDLQKKFDIAQQTVVFTIPKGDGLDPFLVECGTDGIQIIDYNGAKLIDLRQPGKTDEEKTNAFLNWLSMQDLSNKNFTIVLKPATLNFGQMAYRMRGMGAKRGLEFLPENELTLTTPFLKEQGGGSK